MVGSICIKQRWGVALALLASGALALALDRALPPDVRRAHDFSPLVLAADGSLLRGFTTAAGDWRLPLRVTEVEPLFIAMLLAYEDRRFYWHPGVDPLALARALGQGLRAGHIVSGGSTLTMQTARLAMPHPRSVPGKLGELLRALQLEWRFSKPEILEFYLNLAPYGGNLYGLRAASWAYFGKEPRRLTPAEAALLVVLPQAPSQLRPDQFPAPARAARDKVLRRMHALGVLGARPFNEALAEPVPAQRRFMPLHAPHLAQRLYTESLAPVIRTTLDGALQKLLENLALRELTTLDERANIALLVVENASRRVLAYLGSADFFTVERAGQIDLARAVRSPGSTLKPVIYGLGFDDSIIHPETLIDDVPTRFGDYRPTNFHDVYQGQVSVREALQHSLNIPAVAVLERVGPGRVAARLRNAGIPLYWSMAHPEPGLPLALGGVGATLVDLVTLYTGLANSGAVGPLRFTLDAPLGTTQPLLSATASGYLWQILLDTPAPQPQVPTANRRAGRAIAHKTGTSYGFRDAWALGFDQRYTVGVWVGRPDGSPSPGHYGRNTAAPLLFQLFDLLPEPTATPATVATSATAPLPPQPLRYFQREPQATITHAHARAAPLRITFPLDGATVELTEPLLPLTAQGGLRPLRWLVNGQLLSAPALRRAAVWRPDGAGLAQITVLDNAGQRASAHVWIRFP